MAKMLEVDPSGQTLIPKATYLIGPRGPEYRPAKLRAEGQELRADEESGNRIASAKPRKGAVSGCDIYGLVRAGDSATSRHKRRPELVEGFVGSLGHTSEDETGLIYMRARSRNPALGRFISEDPARDGANWFEYCRGNPVNAVDPDGRSATAVWQWLCKLWRELDNAASFSLIKRSSVIALMGQGIQTYLDNNDHKLSADAVGLACSILGVACATGALLLASTALGVMAAAVVLVVCAYLYVDSVESFRADLRDPAARW